MGIVHKASINKYWEKRVLKNKLFYYINFYSYIFYLFPIHHVLTCIFIDMLASIFITKCFPL